MVDVRVRNEGTVWQFFPETDAAKEWVAANVALEAWQWLGKSFAVEARFGAALVDGMQEDGLDVHRS